ncbi:MAG: type II toxin-antitoxin system prevent-host-death family antitoxin [Pseudonocardia sp.]
MKSIPEVRSVREFRAGLTGIIDEVNNDGAGPVFVGSHRKPEAVLMSVSQYQALQDAAERQRAMAEALASVRAEGLEPSPQDLRLLADIASGARSIEDVQAEFLARYRR